MNKAIGYCRVSTQEQAREGISLEAQEDKIKKYAQLHGLELMEIIKDKGKSGKDLNREGIQKVIALCRGRKIQHVIVYKIDRLTRRTLDLLMLIEHIFKPNGVEFHSITEKIDTSTPQGKFFLTIVGAMAQMERDLISERTREALRYKKQHLQVYSRIPPLGFDRDNGRLKPNDHELKIVQLIYDLKQKGLSYQAIVDYLNAFKIPPKRGGSWSTSTVWGILHNDIYNNFIRNGCIANNRGVENGRHPKTFT